MLFTIDPVNVVPGLPKALPNIGNATTAVNYYEKVDQSSLGGLPVPGQPIKGAENIEYKAADFDKKDFHINFVCPPGKKKFETVITNYPDGGLIRGNAKHGHIYLPFSKRLLDDLSDRIAKL